MLGQRRASSDWRAARAEGDSSSAAAIQTAGAPWQTGLFAGYAKNLGSPHEITGANYARGFNVDELYRLSPRLVYNVGKMRFAGEAELTAASYGTPDPFGKVREARFVRNLRLLLAAYYFF